MKYDFEVGKENFKLSSDKEIVQQSMVAQDLNYVNNVLKKDMSGKILDLGSGDGFFQTKVSDAISVSANKDDISQGKLAGFNMVFADAHNLPFKKGTFDYVWARQCFEHFVSPYVALKEVHRVLKKDGIAIIIVPIPLPVQISASTHLYVLDAFQWANLFNKTGFKALDGIQTHRVKDKEVTEDEYIFILKREERPK